jgi:hypothetical protein
MKQGSNLSGIDPLTNWGTELFNPRVDQWMDHFVWEGVRLVGLTDIGRATIAVMDLNSDDRLVVRLMSYRSDA